LAADTALSLNLEIDPDFCTVVVRTETKRDGLSEYTPESDEEADQDDRTRRSAEFLAVRITLLSPIFVPVLLPT